MNRTATRHTEPWLLVSTINRPQTCCDGPNSNCEAPWSQCPGMQRGFAEKCRNQLHFANAGLSMLTSTFCSPTFSRRLPTVPVLSSAASKPFPGAASFAATAARSVMAVFYADRIERIGCENTSAPSQSNKFNLLYQHCRRFQQLRPQRGMGKLCHL